MANKSKRIPDLEIENGFIIPGLRNFSGKPTKFTSNGERTFAVSVTAADAEELAAIGWNVKTLKPREEGDEPVHFLSVKVSFDIIPPKIFMVTDNGPVSITEEYVSLLDNADILQADMVINPYYWCLNGREGYKAYLKALYVTIQEDRFMKKYGF